MSVFLDIELKTVDKIYHEGENLTGVIVIQSSTDFKHDGISLSVDGSVNLQLSAKSTGIFEAFYNSVKPIQILSYSVEVLPPGKLPLGRTAIPFELPLKPKQNRTMYESYQGVFVNVAYNLKCDVKRSFLSKDLQKSVLFFIQIAVSLNYIGLQIAKHIVFQTSQKPPTTPVSFVLSPTNVQNPSSKAGIPKFRITGSIDSTVCNITKPLTGKMVVERCEIPIKSIELQLVRVETCGCAEGYAKDATEIQNIQIGEGDVPKNIEIPVFMIFPRLFTCPTLTTPNFKIEFEVNIVIVLQNDHLVTENFPIVLVRPKS